MRRRILGRYGEQFKELSQQHTVTFIDPINNVLSTQLVKDGESAIEPPIPDADTSHFAFLMFERWSHDYTNVKHDMVIGAIYNTFNNFGVYLEMYNGTGVDQTIQLVANGGSAVLNVEVDDADGYWVENGAMTISGAPSYGSAVIPPGISYTAISTTANGNFAVGHTPSGLGPVRNLPDGVELRKIYNGTKWRGLSSLFFGTNQDTLEAIVLNSAPSVTLINAVTNFSKLKNVIVTEAYSLQQNCFNNCAELEYVVMEQEVGQSNLAFVNCPKLKMLHLPKFNTLLDNFLQQLPSLETVVVESTTTKFNGKVGTDIPNLKKLVLKYQFVMTIDTVGINSIPSGCNVYVNDNILQAYKDSTYWGMLGDRIKPMAELNLQ